MEGVEIKINGKTASFAVKVVPGSSRTCLAGIHDGMLKVKVAAPPEDGKANKALTAFIAKKLGLKKNEITITSGRTSPVKRLEIKGENTAGVVNLLKSL